MDPALRTRAGGCLPLAIDAEGRALRAAFAHVGGGERAAVEAASAEFLHPGEMRFLAGLPAARRRHSYLLGRYAAKRALAAVLPDLAPAIIEIVPGVLDQPVVRHGAREPVDVSISHCDSMACAVAFPAVFPMGVDVEQVEPGRADVMRSQILPEELALARAATASEAAACTLVWTVKEALSKALRCGLTVPFELLALERIESGRGSNGAGSLVGGFRNFGQYGFHAWVTEGFVLALVLPRRSTLESDLAPAVAAMGRS